MNNQLYPQSPQPILFLFIYATHLFYRCWWPLSLFFLAWTVVDIALFISSSFYFTGSTSVMIARVIAGGLVALTCLAWYALIHQMKYVSDHRKSNYMFSLIFVIKRSLALIVFEGLAIFTLIPATLILILPGVYCFLAFFAFKNILYVIQKRPMVASLIESVRLIRGDWFSILFVLLVPLFVLLCLATSLNYFLVDSIVEQYPLLFIVLLAAMKNFVILPFYAALLLTLTQSQLKAKGYQGLKVFPSTNHATT